MIKANDVRIGNLIYWPLPGGDAIIKVNGNTIANPKADLAKSEPIPLTPEILEKAGFENIWEGKWERNSVELYQSDEQKILGGYILLNGEERIHWPLVYFYLHQLQNLYYALTGNELDISL